MVYFNAQSLVKNRNKIYGIVEELRPRIMLASETHVTADVHVSEVDVSGYNYVGCNSDSRHTGGTGVYVHKTLK